MYKNGKLLNRMTYHILIKACLENPELRIRSWEDWGRRWDTTARWRNEIKLLNDTWYVILLGLLRQGHLAAAEQILNDMSHEPDEALSMPVGRLERQIALGRTQGHL